MNRAVESHGSTPHSRLGPVRTALRLTRRAIRDADARDEFARALQRRLRAYPRLRSLVQPHRARPSSSSRARIHVPGGSVLPEGGTARLPVMLVVLLGLSDDEVDGWVEQVARSQMMTAAFKPLFVIDRDHFTRLRRYGYPFEFVLPYEDWVSVGDPSAWTGYVRDRLSGLDGLYRPATMVAATGPPPGDETRQAALDALLSWRAGHAGPSAG